jgi:protein-tyrosine kinase
MDTDDKRVHLIERAAVRLDHATAFGSVAATAEPAEYARPSGNVAATPERAQSSTTAERGLVIEQAMLERAGAVDWDAVDSRVGEEFRIVSMEVLRRSREWEQGGAAPSKLFMVTSALPGEGKSFTALNLALGIARSADERVLLVDADGKAGSLSDLLLPGTEMPGLVDLAADRCIKQSDLILRTDVDNLCFLPFGKCAANENAFGRLAELTEDLGRRADRLVVLDVPPCLSTSRPHLLAPVVGQAVLVVAAGSTQQNDIEAALGLIRSCPRVSLLLNKVSRWNAHSFGSYAYPT